MYYFLMYKLLNTNNKYIKETIFFIGTLCYLITLNLYKTILYPLVIPLDIIYTLHVINTNLYKINKKYIHPSNILKSPLKISTKSIINIKQDLSSNDIHSINNDIINIENIKDKDNYIKTKYIPHKLNIESFLQQTVRNLGI